MSKDMFTNPSEGKYLLSLYNGFGNLDHRAEKNKKKIVDGKEKQINEWSHVSVSLLVFQLSWCPWLLSYEMNPRSRVQILDEADYISHSTYTLGKDMYPTIFPPPLVR